MTIERRPRVWPYDAIGRQALHVLKLLNRFQGRGSKDSIRLERSHAAKVTVE
jgi:hypothetical protein